MSLSQFLRQVPLFDCLGEAELEALAELTVTRSFDKGQFIIMAEEPGDSLFIIRSGQVKVSLIHEDGKEFILSLLGEGEVFGELSLLDDQPRSANVTAMAPTELVMLQRANFRALMTRIPQIAVSLLEELAQRLRRTDDQVEGLLQGCCQLLWQTTTQVPGARKVAVIFERKDGDPVAALNRVHLKNR